MGYKHNYRNLTDELREKGRAKAIANRNRKASLRRRGVKRMRDEGKTKAEIARHYGVNWETINRDCQILDIQTPRAERYEIVDAILLIAHKEVAGEISTGTARREIEKLIAAAAEAEILKRQ